MALKTHNNHNCSITIIAYPCSYESRDLTCMVPSLADSTSGLLVSSPSHLHVSASFPFCSSYTGLHINAKTYKNKQKTTSWPITTVGPPSQPSHGAEQTPGSTPLEQSTQVWKRLMFGLPAGQLSFLARPSIDCLSTPTSLARWNMKLLPSCPLCQQAACTTKYVLSCCKTALNQGWYTWRHDRALPIIAEFIKYHRADASVYCNLQGFRATDNSPSTIPPEILPTSARPDIVIVSAGCISLVELAAPWNSEDSLASAKRHKTTKDNYQLVLSDMASRNIRAKLITVEIGCLGHRTIDLFVPWNTCPLPPLQPKWQLWTTGPSIMIGDCIFLHDLQSPPIPNLATLTWHSIIDLHCLHVCFSCPLNTNYMPL